MIEKLKTREQITAPDFPAYEKIVTEGEATVKSRLWRAKGEQVVVIDVVCDIPHHRHSEYFQECKKLGTKLIVRVDTDELVKVKKGENRPNVPFEQRIKCLAWLPMIDLLCPKSQMGMDWVFDFYPAVVVKSTTSGEKVVKEVRHALSLSYKSKYPFDVVVFDEDCQVVPIEQAEAKGKEYDETKFRSDRHSGSTIERKIQDSKLEQLRKSGLLQCDIPQL